MKTALKIILLVWIVVRVKSSFAQDYNYIHYTAKNGLASNTVYDVAQDDDGFLYFATDNGLSRFDGKEWKTFTVKDGLPDNEVLSLYYDKQKRLWLFMFNKKCCYFYKGRLFTDKNSEIVSKIVFNQPFLRVTYDNGKRLIFSGIQDIYNIEENSVTKMWPAKPTDSKVQYAIFDTIKQKIFLYTNDSIFLVNNDSLIYLSKAKLNLDWIDRKTIAQKIVSDTVTFFKRLKSTLKANQNNENFISTNNGCLYMNPHTEKITLFLEGKKIGHHLSDVEGEQWFTTLDDGIYKLGSVNIQSYSNVKSRNVQCVAKYNNSILAGLNYGTVGYYQDNKFVTKSYQYLLDESKHGDNINRLSCMGQGINGKMLLGFDGFLLTHTSSKDFVDVKILAAKSLLQLDSNTLLISNSTDCSIYDIGNMKLINTIYPHRSTYSTYFANNYYVGTLEGLYKITPQKQQTYLGNNHPSLKRRITCLKTTKDYLIVATADSGIAILQNDKVIKIITENNGLGSNICKTLFVHNNTLYIGTVKGIAVYDMSKWKVTTQFTSSDGLPSNIINAIYVDNDSTIYIGTPEGLTKFKEHDISQQSICNLVVENVVVSNQSLKSDSNNFSIKYNDNVVFNFLAISFRSANKITYYYKLSELNTNYLSTTQRSINYQSLQAGTYTFELYAVNKFGVRSKTYTCTFTVTPPFYKTWWFYLLELGLLTAIIWAIVYTRYRRKQKVYKQVSDFKVQLANMEQQALQSQMNPHFIFNSLNSIQQFVLKNDELSTNKYLASFSRLMRKTLDNSAQKTITLDNEIEYLNEYLQLELLRFNNSFTYKIVADNNIDIDFIQIPSMLLQPFIENAIRHGIRHKQAGVGHIEIQFKQVENILICSVIDNGIGRAASAELKLLEPLKHNSKAMNITAKRIELLNTELQEPIELEIIDLKDSNGNALGTQVNIKIPLHNYASH